jgi:hypothetical protein
MTPIDPADRSDPTGPTESAADAAAAGPGITVPDGWLARVDLVGTAAFVAVTAAAWLAPGDAVELTNLIVSCILFVVGSAIWATGFVIAAGRSRTHVIDLAGLFYLTGSAPRPVRRFFLGLWFLQIAVAVAAVAVTNPPFGVMAPVFGIGALTLWAAAHGTFPERAKVPGPGGRRSAPQ